MLKSIAIWFGAIILLVGILGFFEPVTPNGYLIGWFEVNALHNIVHLLTGAIAIWVGFTSELASRRFFQVFGLIYAVVAILGFLYGDAALLGIMAHNWADAWLHVAIAAFALFLGYGYHPRAAKTA